MRSVRSLALAAFVFLAALPLVAAPTAILVDTSRSIPPAQFEALKGRIDGLLPDLLSRGPVALYAFNDAPVKLADFTTDPGSLRAGVEKLAQGGQYTLLYDCLFAAEKDLAAKGGPGVILLFTDGRDENSAVTLEDFSSRASDAHVAVVSGGLGAIDEKTLRRIAVLTGGQYAGPMSAGAPENLPRLLAETAASLPVPPPPAPKAEPVAPAPPPPQPQPAPAPLGGSLFLILALSALGVALLVVIVVGVVLLLKRTRAPEERVCDQCGRPLNTWEAECPACMATSLSLPKGAEQDKAVSAEALPELDPSLMKKAPPSEMLEHTLVLDQVPILVLQRQGGPPRMFQLPPDGVVSVGRDKVNTLSVADQTLSAQHFRIIPKEGKYYLADLQSTNGTLLDGKRVSLAELQPGSVIRAGQCEFTFKLEQKKLN
jgi:hypothetical protein